MVARLAYQAPEVAGLHPMDAALNLPPELYSHGICRFVAQHAAMMSFDDVVGELLTATGTDVGKRQVEEIAVRAATDFEAFYTQGRAANDVLEDTDFGERSAKWRAWGLGRALRELSPTSDPPVNSPAARVLRTRGARSLRAPGRRL